MAEFTLPANSRIGTGKTWTATEAPASAYNLTGVSCPSTTSCFAVSWGIGQPEGLTRP